MIDQCFTLALVGAFPALYVFSIAPATDLPIWFKVPVAIATLLCALYMLYTMRKILRLLTTNGSWKATIENGRLVWVSGLENSTFPIEVELVDIAMVARLVTLTKGSDIDVDETVTFELHLKPGGQIDITQEDSGLRSIVK